MQAIRQRVAADKSINLLITNELELALHDQFPPPLEENRLPCPSGFTDAQSESGHSDDDEQSPTQLSQDEVEEPVLAKRRTNSPPNEPPPPWPPLCEEQAKIIDQGINVWRFAPNGPNRPQILDHKNISDHGRQDFLKQCSKRLLRYLRREVSGCNIAMQLGGWVPVPEAIRGLSKEFSEANSNNPERDLLCVLEFANQGVFNNSFEPYPRVQLRCVQKGYRPDDPETPEQRSNLIHMNVEQLIPSCGATVRFAITHVRAGHGMTRREGRNSPVPNRVWNTTDYTPIDEAMLQRSELFAETAPQKMKIPYAGSKPQMQNIDFDMTEYVRDSLDQSCELPYSASYRPSGQRLGDQRSRFQFL